MDVNLICYSGSVIGKNLQHDKIILSPKLLSTIVDINHNNDVWIWRIETSSKLFTYCTVLEFISNDESIAYVPSNIMDKLSIVEGDIINLSLVCTSIEKPHRIIFQPLQSSFLRLNRYKEILENSLKNYAVLCKDDVININTEFCIEKLIVVQILYNQADMDVCCILNSNVEVDFVKAVNESVEEFNYFNTNENKNTNNNTEQKNEDNTEETIEQKNEYNTEQKNEDNTEQKISSDVVNSKDEKKEQDVENDILLQACQNCKYMMLQKNIMLHELHCYKTYFYCDKCNTKILKILKEEHVHCEYCNVGIFRKDYHIHLRNHYKKVKCTYCKHDVDISDISSHLLKCEYAPVICSWCNIEVPMIKITQHENICSSKTVECDICGKFVINKKMVVHKAVEHGVNPCKPLKHFHTK